MQRLTQPSGRCTLLPAKSDLLVPRIATRQVSYADGALQRDHRPLSSSLLWKGHALGGESLPSADRAHGALRAGCLAGSGRLVGGHELVGARADKVGATHLLQGIAQQ